MIEYLHPTAVDRMPIAVPLDLRHGANGSDAAIGDNKLG
jgi:hypothetical protein